jgi:hypothetical protein
MNNQIGTQAPSSDSPAIGKDSDLAEAAAGLLSFAPSIQHSATTSAAATNAHEQRSFPANNPIPVITYGSPPSAASRAAGLRSLQAVESIIKSQHMKSVPPNPMAVKGEITPEQEREWKRARSRTYTQRNRAKKTEQIDLLERGIAFFKRQLGVQQSPSIKSNNRKCSKPKGSKRNVYLPLEEELAKMTDAELTEWKRKERLKRKREANAASTKQHEDQMIQLAIEHEMLHDQYKTKCRETGSAEQDWFEEIESIAR